MAIDDPQDAIEALIASEARLRSPAYQAVSTLCDVLCDFIPLGGTISAVRESIFLKQDESLRELARVLSDELRYVKEQLKRQTQEHSEHKEFLQNDFLGLVVDAFQRAERTRSLARVRRLGKILGHTASPTVKTTADYAEEMMRIAVLLDEDDVRVLQTICKLQRNSLGGDKGRVARMNAGNAQQLRLQGMSDGSLMSVCAKLASFGLIWEAENRALNNLSEDIGPYGLLQKGLDFITFVQGASEEKV